MKFPPDSEPLIIGHRGASRDAPENTLAAFELAFEQGADGLEFDVRLARDRLAVVIHDATLERTARRRELVSALSSEELGNVDVGAWFDAKHGRATRSSFAGQCVPTLAQVFELAGVRARALYVEMKFEDANECGPLAASVVEEVHRHKLEDRVVVESFRLEAVALIKQLAPNVRTAALFERKLARPLPRASKIIERALECRADELALQHTLASKSLVDAARDVGMRSLVWTVDQQSWIDRALRYGLCAVITNRPAHMRARLDALRAGS